MKPRRILGLPPVCFDLPLDLPPVWDREFKGSLTEFHDLPPSGTDLFIIFKKGSPARGKFHSVLGSRLGAPHVRILVGSVFQGPMQFAVWVW